MTNTPTTFFGWIIFLIQQYHGYYLQGLLTTLETSLAGTICGCFLGFLVGIIQATDIRAQDNMIKKILLGILQQLHPVYILSMGDRKNLCHDFPWNTNDRSGNGNLLWIIYSIRN